MSKKIEKLKEVNAMIQEHLIKLETKLFVENNNIISQKTVKEPDAKLVIEIKPQ